MRIRIGLDQGIEGRALAWALDHPGCFAYGPDGQAAVVAMGRAVPDYITWMESHTSTPWFSPAEIDIRLVDVFETYRVNRALERVGADAPDGFEVNAWFQTDWQPLTHEEVDRGLQLLAWTRADFMDVLAQARPDQLAADPGEEEWPLEGIISHVSTNDWWCLDRLDLAPVGRYELPGDPFQRLAATRQMLLNALAALAGRTLVVGKAGEFWSPRKLLRRVVWHERDHTGHARQVLARLS